MQEERIRKREREREREREADGICGIGWGGSSNTIAYNLDLMVLAMSVRELLNATACKDGMSVCVENNDSVSL